MSTEYNKNDLDEIDLNPDRLKRMFETLYVDCQEECPVVKCELDNITTSEQRLLDLLSTVVVYSPSKRLYNVGRNVISALPLRGQP